MSKRIVYALLMTSLFSCGKNSDEAQLSNTVQGQSSTELVKMIANENDSTMHELLLLNSTTKSLLPENAEEILNLHSIKKINDIDFRTLFWNTSISKELLIDLEKNIATDSNISKLDNELINSIRYSKTELKTLIELIKDDSVGTIPTPMKNALIDEALRIQSKNNFKENNLEVAKHSDLKENVSINSAFLKQFLSILELSNYKNLLKNNKLVTKPINNLIVTQNYDINFNLNYNFNIGRCGNFRNSLQFTDIETGVGRQCNTETPSTVNLDLFNKVTQSQDRVAIDLLVNSFVRGGYDRGHSENATSILNYNLNGTISIPKCENPSYCSQLVGIMINDFGRSFSNSNQTNNGVMIKVNGEYFENKPGNSITVDISKHDAKIEFSLSQSKKHVGACCYNSAEFQKVNLLIFKKHSPMNLINLSNEEMDQISPYHQIFDLPFFMYLGMMDNEGYPTPTLAELDRRITYTLSNKENIDDYRYYFYTSLNLLRNILDKNLKNGVTDPLTVTNINQLISSISDRIGRKTIYPIIINKQVTYSQTSYNLQSKLNSIIIDFLNNDISSSIIDEKISNIMKNEKNSLDQSAIEKLADFQNTIKDVSNSNQEILKKITNLQSDFSYINKRANIEIELLNYERAQFE